MSFADDPGARLSRFINRRRESVSPEHLAYGYLGNAKRIECPDGFSVSVQASAAHYCEPRDNRGVWWKFELGFPTESVPELMRYAEDANKPTETVYGWVPAELVVEILSRHGLEIG